LQERRLSQQPLKQEPGFQVAPAAKTYGFLIAFLAAGFLAAGFFALGGFFLAGIVCSVRETVLKSSR